MLSGIFGGIVTAAVTRLGPLAVQKFVRLRKIDAAIKSGRFMEPALKQAISDLETVLGTYRGELTVRVADFIGELERSGILNSIAEEIITNKQNPGNRACFIALHECVFGKGEGKPEEFFNKIKISL